MNETVLGFDVSWWNDSNSTPQKVDFVKAYNAGIRFAMIKSSQALYQDEDILYNWKTCKAAGILRTAYHFLDWAADPVQQARYAWSLIQADPPELPPMIDYESWNVVPTNSEDKLWAYLQEMELLSRRIPIIYTGAFFWESQANQDPKWKKYPLVIASYTTREYMESSVIQRTPWDTWTFWQYTSKGNGPTYGTESLNVDLDLFNGTYEQLLAMTTTQMPLIPVVDPHIAQLENLYNELYDLHTSMLTSQATINKALTKDISELGYIKGLIKPGG